MAEPKVVIVVADCHIHPGGGPSWPDAALEAFREADLFITLGDMGASTGLDALQAIAPVVGVRGEDDEDDERTRPAARVVQFAGQRLGCVFDPLAHGLAEGKTPLAWAPGAAAAIERTFGGPVDALLYASTHAPACEAIDGRRVLNPGSVTLPAGKPGVAKGAYGRIALTESGTLSFEVRTL